MKQLQQFAKYLRKDKLNEFANLWHQVFTLFNPEAFKAFSNGSEQKLNDFLNKYCDDFLKNFEDDTALEGAKLRFKKWENNNLQEGIEDGDLFFADLLLSHAAQKKTLIDFIASYTAEVSIAVEIVLSLEHYYKEIQTIASQHILTNQKIIKKSKSELEKNFKKILENTHDLINVVDIEGVILNVNKAWETILGYKEEEVKGKSIYSFISPQHVDVFKAKKIKIINEGTSGFIETILISKNGQEIVIEGTSTCNYKEGVLEHVYGIWRDVTKRKSFEKRALLYTEKLQESESNLKQLINNAPDAIIVIDIASNILLWNPKCEEIFGWREDEVKGQLLSNLIIPIANREAHTKGIERYLATKVPHMMNKNIEVLALNKAGKEFYISLTISETKQDKQTVFIAFLRDISESKHKEEELQKRTLQLENTNHKLEQFARLTSHDLKEPVRKILTNSDLLLTRFAEQLTGEVNIRVEKIMDSASRMSKLIEGILAYSSASNETSLYTMVDLTTILKEVLKDLEVLIDEKKAVITISPLPTLYANPFQMRQLFQNLIGNALKYSRVEVPVKITIAAENIGNEKVKIKVADNGIGFNNKYAEKIFEIFQRLSTEAEYEGVGIGLALCKQIVEGHHGIIKAISEVNKGSVFLLELPINYRNN
ncbi:MAG: PAS domain S-box protein [Bacteroidia bacterium]